MARMAIGNNYNLKRLHVGYPTTGQHSFSPVQTNMQILLHDFAAYNTGAASDVGLGVVNASPTWRVYAGDLTGVPVNVTSAVQAGSATTLIGTTNDYGFLVTCSKQFGYLTLNVSQTQTGAPVYVYEYWNGSAWATLTANQTPVYTSTGYVHLTFNPPPDWAIGDGGLGSNDGYAVRVKATTAPTQAVQVTLVRVARWLKYRKSVPILSELAVKFVQHPMLLEAGEALVAYFQTATATNMLEASYQQAP